MLVEKLPNQNFTWDGISNAVVDFDDWKKQTNSKHANPEAELLSYLTDQIAAEEGALTGKKLNGPATGLLSYMSESNNRMQELMYSYLAIVLANDCTPARRLINGYRLNQSLHPSYVANTQCY